MHYRCSLRWPDCRSAEGRRSSGLVHSGSGGLEIRCLVSSLRDSDVDAKCPADRRTDSPSLDNQF